MMVCGSVIRDPACEGVRRRYYRKRPATMLGSVPATWRARMSRFTIHRRRFLHTTALGAAAVVAAPAVLRAQGSPVKVGILHPVSGALSYSGQQGRIGAQL